MSTEQINRMERKLDALCKAAGVRERPASGAERRLAAIRQYAETLAASAVPSERSHAATLLAILDADS